ncbi:aerobic-type carbon monoxide dehydrogenase small subunit (CoxS/CutS family) [Bradyrhizobium sp. RT6a]
MMAFVTHGDQKYQNSEKLAKTSEWPALSIEHRKFEAGHQATPAPICTELVMLLSGGGMVHRIGNGEVQKSLARPGMSYLVPAGTQESHLELSDRMECLHLYLPPALLDQSALADFDIDPAKVEIAYAHGLPDQVLFHVCSPLRDLLHRPRQPTDALFVEGIQVALAAHLLAHYTIDRWRPPEKSPSLDARRLQRVLDHIEASLGLDIRLEELAGAGLPQSLSFFEALSRGDRPLATPLRDRSARPGRAARTGTQPFVPGRHCAGVRFRVPSQFHAHVPQGHHPHTGAIPRAVLRPARRQDRPHRCGTPQRLRMKAQDSAIPLGTHETVLLGRTNGCPDRKRPHVDWREGSKMSGHQFQHDRINNPQGRSDMIELTVNGIKRQVDVVPEMPLLWVLRDELGITSPKYGCGVAQCGACTVHIDGKAVRSCQSRIGEVAGKSVVTIEGLENRDQNPVLQAWIDHQVPQCGYCQTGQIMQAISLLERASKPTDELIDQLMSGNLCRCGTYPRIRAAIHAAAAKKMAEK